MSESTAKVADVCLMLEGTYPYVLGGVSSWVDQIIKGLPDITFALFFIGSQKELSPKVHYKIPENVVSLTEVYLHDKLPPEQLAPGKLAPETAERLYSQLKRFYLAKDMKERSREFWLVLDCLEELDGKLTFGNLMNDFEAWEVLKEGYQTFASDESFIDFFWTVRFLHLPLWSLWLAHGKIPQAKVYHSVSAGYAGLVAAIAAHQRKTSFLLTEHGIYTKERIAEISQADWIYEGELEQMNFSQGLGKLKQLWIGLFMLQGQLAYDKADRVITLYEGNVYTQIEFGADPAKLGVIPNGIEPTKFDGIREQVLSRWQPEPPMKYVGFVGRVVPIKDVKTLLRAARLVCEKCPNVHFLIAGPYAEDPGYFEECQKIVKLLAIDDKVQFLGMQKLMEILPKMDVMVLTSISEGLPLVVLEAFAAGIPVVSTDVGACRELIFGRTPEDRALGRAGRLTKILAPQETAQSLVNILQNHKLWRQLGEAGRLRVEKHYTMTSMLGGYRELYQTCAEITAKKQEPLGQLLATA